MNKSVWTAALALAALLHLMILSTLLNAEEIDISTFGGAQHHSNHQNTHGNANPLLIADLSLIALNNNPEELKPEIAPAPVKKPEVKKPEVKKPEVKKPEVKKPEVKKPEVKKPEVKKPEVKKPEVKKSEESISSQAPPLTSLAMQPHQISKPGNIRKRQHLNRIRIAVQLRVPALLPLQSSARSRKAAITKN